MNNLQNAPRPYTFDRTVRLVITVIFIVVAIIIINYLKGVILPFLFACVLAYVIHPVVEFNARLFRVKGKIWPVVITLAEIFSLIVLFFLYVVPFIIDEVIEMVSMVGYYAKENLRGSESFESIRNFIVSKLDLVTFSDFLNKDSINEIISNLIYEIWDLMGKGVMFILSVLSWSVVILYFVFILIDYDSIMSGFKAMIPKKYKSGVLMVIGDIECTMSHYFRGQALVSFIVGMLFSAGFLMIDLPMAVIFGIFIGILNMVPYLQLISIPFAAFLGVVLSVNTGQSLWIIAVEITAVYCICQLIQDFILIPRIMKRSMGLNPAIVFLSLAIWGALLGFIGLIVALPLTTLIISYYKRYVIKKPYSDDMLPETVKVEKKE